MDLLQLPSSDDHNRRPFFRSPVHRTMQLDVLQSLRHFSPFRAWWRSETGPEIPPSNYMLDIMQQGDTLWTLVTVPDPDWKSAVRIVGRRPADGRVLFWVDDRNAYHNTVVEAIDLRRGHVVVSTRVPWMVKGFARPGLVYGENTDQSGNPTVPVWELQILDGGQRRNP